MKTTFALSIAIAMSTEAIPALAQEVSEPGMTWDCGFSPEGTSLQKVMDAIAEGSVRGGTIFVEAYEFTSRPIAEALIAAKQRGAAVAVVADTTENQKQYSKVRDLVAAGIPVRFDNTLQMLHSKTLIVNGSIVETGSFNFTGAAASNRHAENACVFRHVARMASEFTQTFRRLWNESDSI